jgi:hypothetical protein
MHTCIHTFTYLHKHIYLYLFYILMFFISLKVGQYWLEVADNNIDAMYIYMFISIYVYI